MFESKKLGDRINWVAGGAPRPCSRASRREQFDAIMAVPGWVIECETKASGR